LTDFSSIYNAVRVCLRECLGVNTSGKMLSVWNRYKTGTKTDQWVYESELFAETEVNDT